MGDKDLKEKDLEKKLKEEKEMEEKVEEKIRELRKSRNKNPKLTLPARKRIKLEDGTGVNPKTMEASTTEPQKRTVQMETEWPKGPPRKKVKHKENITEVIATIVAKTDNVPESNNRENENDCPGER